MIELIYNDGKLVTRKLSVTNDLVMLRRLKNSRKNIWLNVTAPSMDELNFLGKIFRIHTLVLEDMYTIETKPKLEHFKGYDFFVMHGVYTRKDMVGIKELDFILGDNFLISSHRPPIDTFDNFKKNRVLVAKYLDRGNDFLLHHLVDMEVDNYFPVLDRLDDRIDDIGERVIKDPDPLQLDKLLKLKRQLIMIRKYVMPQREIISQVVKENSPFVSKNAVIYFRDIYDHMIRITDSIDSHREVVSGTMDVHLSVSSNKMNEVMKVLTIIATIMMPLTLIVGIYGMNFRFMPELEWRYSYPVVILVMVAIVALMLRFFKKKGWI